MLGFLKKLQAQSDSIVTENDIQKQLQGVILPSGVDIFSSGAVSGLSVRQDGHVSFVIEVSPEQAGAMEPIRVAAEKAVMSLPGVKRVTAVLTAKNDKPLAVPSAVKAVPAKNAKLELPHLKKIIAVASGKGGVGKSTTAVNLAIAFSQMGLSVGLLDADIYGPSVPLMLGLAGKPPLNDKKQMIPPEKFGLKAMSIGLLTEADAPLVWRGPMVHTAIQQLFRDVDWGERDVVVVDMPPGTGDAQLTLAQTIPLSGAVIVSTPQDISLIDARKGLAMFQKVNIPVLGIIENMSYFDCPHCGNRSDIFHHGGAKAEAERLQVPFCGEIPLDIAVRTHADSGTPIAFAQPDGAQAKKYREIAEQLWKSIA